MIIGSLIFHIAGIVFAAILAGSVIYILAKITINYLKKYRKKKNSKILAAQVKDMIKRAPTLSLDDLPDIDEDDVLLAEYNDEEDELVQDITVAKDIDEKVIGILNSNEGIVVFD